MIGKPSVAFNLLGRGMVNKKNTIVCDCGHEKIHHISFRTPNRHGKTIVYQCQGDGCSCQTLKEIKKLVENM